MKDDLDLSLPPLVEENQDDERNVIVSELSGEATLKMEIIQRLREPCDRRTYGQRLQEAADQLGKSKRTVQRLVKKWEEEGLQALTNPQRSDKGSFRISSALQEFIVKAYEDGNKGSRRISPKQVYMKTRAKADELGIIPPSHMTVYRILEPLIEKREKKKSIRSPGWRGSQLSLKTREGLDLSVEYSNHVWQCDHTRVDILLVDQYGNALKKVRPWITTVVDSYSRCIMGINLGYDAPSTDLIAMALRHAILPKHYGSEYQLQNEWGTYGKPGHFFTDGGSDFRAGHVKQIAAQIDFSCHLRDRPSEGGIVERPFKTFNTELFSTLPGYVAENVQKRPEDAEKEACLTLRELERIVVRYIVDNYNQRIDARTGDQTRFQRWEAGLIASPDIMSERELDICLMKQTMRKVQRGGHLQFENLMYRGEELGGYAGGNVILRFDPRDITTVLVYQQKGHQEEFIARAYAMDLETECISLYEAKANSKRLRDAGKDINNRSILAEIRDRHIFSDEKTKKVRRKEEPSLVISAPTKVTSISTNEMRVEDEKEQEELPSSTSETHEVRVFDYEELQEDYGF